MAKRRPHPALEDGAAQIQRQVKRGARFLDKGDHPAQCLRQGLRRGHQARGGKTRRKVTTQRFRRLTKAKKANALRSGANKQGAEGAFGFGDPDLLTRAAAPGGAGGHAKMLGAVFINPAFAAKACPRHGFGHARPFGQSRRQAPPAYAFSIGTRRDAGDVAKHPLEVMRRIARARGQLRE